MALLEDPGQQIEERLPERRVYGMQPTVEAALRDRLPDVAVVVQKRAAGLDVTAKECGGRKSYGHHLGGGQVILRIVAVTCGLQELLAEVIGGDYGIVQSVLPIQREGFRRPSDREDILYRDRGQLGLFSGTLGGVSRGGDEFDEAIYLVGEHGHEDPHHQEQRHQYPQVGEPYGEGALHEPVSALEPVYGRVEHRRQKEGDHEPADEGPDLPQEEERAKHHSRGQEGYGHCANHLSRRGTCPTSILAWHGRVRFRRCRFGLRLRLRLGVPLWVLVLVHGASLQHGRVGYLHLLLGFP